MNIIYFFLSAMLINPFVPVSANTVSDNDIPVMKPVKDFFENLIENIKNDGEVIENEDIEIVSSEGAYIDNQVLPLENSPLPDYEKILLENQALLQEFLSVSDNSNTVSDNSLSANDLIPLLLSMENLNITVRGLADGTPGVNAYQLTDYYINYFRGILQNMGYTDYLAYAQRVPVVSGYNQYVNHYYLMYDLEFDDLGNIVVKNYPTYDIYTSDGVYYCNKIQKRFEGYPSFGYASFAPYSALIDRSFHYNDLYVSLIAVFVLFIIGRKTLFS